MALQPMNILGISGFDGSVGFKKAQWPGLSEREYRIVQGLDSAAALFVDGELIAAAAEERFTRHKHTGAFPESAIAYCLAEAGLTLGAIDEIVHSFDYGPHRLAYSLDQTTARLYREVLSPEAVRAEASRRLGALGSEFVHLDHHLSHAASAYFCSGWDECLVAVVDGMGETQSASIYRAGSNRLQRLAAISARDSLGIFYSLVTFHLGFDFNADEYKVMGLAPYGNPERFGPFFEHAITLNPDGTIVAPLLHLNRTRDDRETYGATRSYLERFLGRARLPEDPITDDHRDVAAALQHRLDQAMLHLCASFARRSGMRRLALAGGVSLNCTANGALVRSGAFDEVFIQPAAGDDGSALGAAAYRAALHGEIRNRRIPTPFLGPAYSPSSLTGLLQRFADRIEVVYFDSLRDTCQSAAELIAEGYVVGWYRGRMEFGPRALGHRSILADPGDPQMRERINAMVKLREAFRPFAPAVTLRQVPRWFQVEPGTELPYMISTVNVRREYRDVLPAVTHVDGSARLQTVSPHDNYEFHMLLEAVGAKTGREVVLNTSFNVKGQPIVNTPEQALETFLNCGIDCLFLGDILIRRRLELNGESFAYRHTIPDPGQLERLRHV
jgi:carbamoyltransferase